MTAADVHGGLTPTGVEVVQMMNSGGLVIDIAHASEATCYGVLDASTKPLLCSHTHIHSDTVPDIHRFISLDLARTITSAGGVIGAWPAGFGITDLNGFIDRIFGLIEAVGIDHVVLGTDMDANYKPVMETYRKTPWLVGGLFKRGLSETEVAQIMGGNFMNLWEANAQA
jgi:membrane dipeptidase